MITEERSDPGLEPHATILLPPTEQAEATALAQAAFTWVRLYAIQLSSFTITGECLTIQPLFHRFVAGSSCFFDGGPEIF
jgi:hypothetical protein